MDLQKEAEHMANSLFCVDYAMSLLQDAIDSSKELEASCLCYLLRQDVRKIESSLRQIQCEGEGIYTEDWLKEIRGAKSQREVAEQAGITQAFYCEIESGKKRPSVPVAKKIAAILGFEWTRFFDYA